MLTAMRRGGENRLRVPSEVRELEVEKVRARKETEATSFGKAFLFGHVLWDGRGELKTHRTPPLHSAGLRGRGGDGGQPISQ